MARSISVSLMSLSAFFSSSIRRCWMECEFGTLLALIRRVQVN